MPAQGRGPRAGGGAQSPESPNEVRSPRPRLVERAGGRANPRGSYGKGGRLKIILSVWEARERSLASFGARGLQGRWRWGGQSGIPPPPRGGVPAYAPRRHVYGAARPSPLHPSGGAPSPGPGAAGSSSRRRSLARSEGSVVIYYLRALIGLRHKGWVPGRWGDLGVRRRGGEGGAAARVVRTKSPPDSSLRAGAMQGAGRAVRAFDFASPSLSFGVLALPGARGGGCGLYAPPCAPLAAVPTQPGPHLSSSLVKWSVQGTAASLG